MYILAEICKILAKLSSVSSDGMDFARIDLPDILYSMEYANFKRTSRIGFSRNDHGAKCHRKVI